MPRKYTIRPGNTFRVSDDKLAHAGEVIELEDDVAARFSNLVDLVEDDATTGVTDSPAASVVDPHDAPDADAHSL